MTNLLTKLILLVICVKYTTSSLGDRTTYFQECLKQCSTLNCTADNKKFINWVIRYIYNYGWSCEDDCKYECMWRTVDFYKKQGFNIPQFYGKWPFVRIFGIQEPASTLFSLLNLYAHVKMFSKFKMEVRPDSPLYSLWYAYFLVCSHSWIWSTIFHSRDTDLTEFMDYWCAFALVLMNCYCMAVRILKDILPRFGLVVLTTLFLSFFISHVKYLWGKFDYGYNMQVNISVGGITAVGWFVWCMWNRKRQPYVYKCVIFVIGNVLVILLELWDGPPFLWTIDSHALWHLSTAPVACFLYSFMIDDCKYLRKMKSGLIGEGLPHGFRQKGT